VAIIFYLTQDRLPSGSVQSHVPGLHLQVTPRDPGSCSSAIALPRSTPRAPRPGKELAVLAGLPSRPLSTASGRKDTLHTTHSYRETAWSVATRRRVKMGKTRDCSTEMLPVTLL